MADTSDRKITVSIEARITDLERKMRKAGQVTASSVSEMERATRRGGMALDQFGRKLNSVDASRLNREMAGLNALRLNGLVGQVNGLKGALGGILAAGVGAAGVQQIVRLADGWTELANKIKAAGVPTAEVGRTQAEVVRIAMAARAPLGAVGELYTGLVRSSKELGASQEEAAAATEIISKAFSMSGKSAGETQGAITQLTQALAAGVLRGDELNSVLEGAPQIAALIAKEFGTTTGQLKALGEAGELSAARVLKGILAGKTEIDTAFAQTNSTVSQAVQNVSNVLVQYVGQVDTSVGASQRLAAVINAVAANLPAIGSAAATVAEIIAAVLVGRALLPLIAQLAASTAAAARFVLGLNGLTAALVASQAASAASAAATARLSAAMAALGGPAGVILTVLAAIGVALATFVRNDEAAAQAAENHRAAMLSLDNAIRAASSAIPGSIENVRALAAAHIEGASAALAHAKAELAFAAAQAEAAKSAVFSGSGEEAALGGAAVAEVNNNVDIKTKQVEERTAELRALEKKLNDFNTSVAKGETESKIGTVQPVALPKVKVGKGGGGGGGRITSPNELEQEIEQLRRRTEQLRIETATLGQSTLEVEKARAAFDLMNAAKRAGIDVSDQVRARIEAEALAYGEAAQAAEDARNKQQQIDQFSQEIGGALANAFSSAVVEGEKLDDVLKNLLKTLANMAINSAFQTLFGGGSGGGSSLFGSLLGNLLGTGGGGAGASLGSFLYHSGGIVGSGYAPRRQVSATAFLGAPRFHNGLRSDEMAAILQKGEMVLTRRQQAATAGMIDGLARSNGESSGGAVTVNQVNNFGSGADANSIARMIPAMKKVAIAAVREAQVRRS